MTKTMFKIAPFFDAFFFLLQRSYGTCCKIGALSEP